MQFSIFLTFSIGLYIGSLFVGKKVSNLFHGDKYDGSDVFDIYFNIMLGAL